MTRGIVAWPTWGNTNFVGQYQAEEWPEPPEDWEATPQHDPEAFNGSDLPPESDAILADDTEEVYHPGLHSYEGDKGYEDPAELTVLKRRHGPLNVTAPQPGPQMRFLTTAADIAIYGGAAGGGKTWALLFEASRHIKNPYYGAVIFRRTSVQVRNEGGLWDESLRMYPGLGGAPREHDLWWKFPSGSNISFAHLEHDKNAHDYQGAQIPLIAFDELTHFTEAQFWYMVSRNRSTCGVKPYIRATCNPDVDSWVAKFISWWINQDTGYAYPERAGKLRYFVRIGDKLHWASDPKALSRFRNPVDGKPIKPKSATFIPSKLTDNKVLTESDPGYMANLLALPLVERERLLNGNLKIRWTGQQFFNVQNLLVNRRPVANPTNTDSVFAVLDTASKTGHQHDGTAVVWVAKNKYTGYPLTILDWETLQISGNLLEKWLPSVFIHGERLARRYGAREGFVGAWIEDKQSGTILLQQARRRNFNVFPIESKLTLLGKDERALSVSGYVGTGKVKVAETAFNKTLTYKDITRNHFLSQVESFSIADPDNKSRADDLLDCFCYAVAIGLGDWEGF